MNKDREHRNRKNEYWKNPERYRQLQREKYARYPEKIKEYNQHWQEKNREYFKTLVNLNSRIWYARKKGQDRKVVELIEEKEMIKQLHRKGL